MILGGGQGLARVGSLFSLCGFWKSNRSSGLAALAFTHRAILSALDYGFLREQSLVFIKIFIGQNNSEREGGNQ